MDAIIYKITCITNLHVGDGESNFDIIDNTVEKDPVTGLPTINSSGVKGALRQYFMEKKVNPDNIEKIFGSDQKISKGTSSFPGNIKFYQADLLARPARASIGEKTNYMVTSKEAIDTYNLKVEIFGGVKINLNTPVNKQISVEGLPDSSIKVRNIIQIDSETIILSDSELRDLSLPVLARNQLDDGISKNLWYEQVVPHKSLFTFAVSSYDKDVIEYFKTNLGESAYVQIGGNASIGYGLCKIERIGV